MMKFLKKNVVVFFLSAKKKKMVDRRLGQMFLIFLQIPNLYSTIVNKMNQKYINLW